MTKKWIEVNDLSTDQYSVSKNIRRKASMLISNLSDYSNPKGRITVKGYNSNN